jgi:purine-binding chemotaxis protein CheW
MSDPAKLPAEHARDLRRFLTFRVGARLYALPATEVSAVIRIPPVARVPHSPKSLLGLANLRGAVVPLISTHALLGQAPAETDNAALRAIVLDGAVPIALAVDAVEALVTRDATEIETHQTALTEEVGERLHGAFKSRSGITKILDIQALLGAAFGQQVRPAQARPGQTNRPTRVLPAVAAAAPAIPPQRLVTFDVAAQEHALPLEDVREIVTLPDAVTVTPHAEAVLLGVMSYRDSLLPLLSLRLLLGFAGAETMTGAEKVIVLPVGGVLVGLVADKMRAILQADAAQLDPTPAMLAARTGGETRIRAIFRGEGGRRLISVLAPEQLFREDVMQRLGDRSGFAHPGPAAEDHSDRETLQFLVFRLADDAFGLPIGAVDEVARVPTTITGVPRTPKFLEGIINLRGEVLPVVDQRKRFDMPKFTGGDGQRLIVVRSERHRAGLIVDSVSEVLRSRADAVEPPPDLSPETTRLISGVINLPATGAGSMGRMILLLDPDELLSRTERSLLDAFGSRVSTKATA